MASVPAPAPVLILASTFYTPALEKPFANAPTNQQKSREVVCVPYNQLQAFLLNPAGIVPAEVSCQIVLVLRLEDLIRPELTKADRMAPDEIARVFQERARQLEELLGRTQLRLSVLLCPSGRGHYDVQMLGIRLRLAEHKIASALRLRQRHMVVEWFEWPEFHEGATTAAWFNLAGDRLGHVPFTPQALDRIAAYVVASVEELPINSTVTQTGAADPAALEKFLRSLELELTAAPLRASDEQPIVDLVRHTTHFVNLVDRRWDRACLRELIGSGEAWVVRVRDRFGDYGLSGAVTFHVECGVMKVGLVFLTCPVLGKQVEHAVFAWLGQVAAERAAECIEIPFTHGRDNEGLCTLLADLGEDSIRVLPLGTQKTFRLRVSGLSERATRRAVNPAAVSEILSAMSAGSTV